MRGSNETKARPARKPGKGGKGRGKDTGKGGVSLKIFAPAIVFTVIMMGTLAWFGWYSYRHLRAVETQHLRTTRLIGIITHLDEVLTMSARMGAATGDSQWERRYGEYEPKLDAAIKELTSLAPEAIMSDAVIQTDSANIVLVGMERKAFELVRGGNLSEAAAILDSGKYAEQKEIYIGGMRDFTEALQAHMRAEIRRHRRQILIAASFVAASASLVLLVWIFMLHKLKYVYQRRKTEKSLRASEERLTVFLDSAPITFLTFDRDLNLTAINGAGIEMPGSGMKKDDVIGKNMRDFYPGLEETDEYRKYLEVLETGKAVFIEDVGLGPRFGDVHVSVSAFKVAGGLGLIVADVTERRKAEETLQESEEKYRTLAGNIPGMVFRAKSDWFVDFVSNSESLCGWVPEEFYEQRVNWLDIIHPEDKERVLSEGESLARKAGSLVQEYTIITKDGDTRWVEDRKTCSLGEGDSPAVIDGIVFDITDRKRVENALRESEEGMSIAQRVAHVGSWERDLKSGRVIWSDQAFRMLGLEPGAIKPDFEVFMSYVHPDDKDRVRRTVESAMTDSASRVEFRVIRADGVERFFEGQAELVLESSGEPSRILGICQDITERKRAEAALQESEERYRTVVENAGETIAVVGRGGAFQFVNKTGAERLGGEPEDYIGKTMWDVFPKEIADRQAASVDAVINSGRGMNFIAPTELQGEMRWYNTTIEPLRDSGGEVTSVLIIARDIHEMRQAEMEIDAYSEKMTQAERLASLGTISATLAHELTQPLTVISLSIEDSLTELDEVSCPRAVREGLRDSLKEVANVTAIVERFRNFARKSSAKTVNKVKLKDVAERIIKLLSRSAKQAMVDLHVKGMEKLPTVYFNEKEMEQLFFALVQNSIQAADGKGRHNLVIEGAAKGEYIEMRFEDDCGGVKAEDVKRIFEPFFTTKATGEGTGLGLCIVQRVAERSGGEVRVDNRPGEGVTIIVTLGIGEQIVS